MVHRASAPGAEELVEEVSGGTELPLGCGQLHSLTREPLLRLLGARTALRESLCRVHAHSRVHYPLPVHAVLPQAHHHSSAGPACVPDTVGHHYRVGAPESRDKIHTKVCDPPHILPKKGVGKHTGNVCG